MIAKATNLQPVTYIMHKLSGDDIGCTNLLDDLDRSVLTRRANIIFGKFRAPRNYECWPRHQPNASYLILILMYIKENKDCGQSFDAVGEDKRRNASATQTNCVTISNLMQCCHA